MTPAEARLWRYLRNGHVGGMRFRRQHPIGRYIADFCCVERRLAIELDGLSHECRGSYDAARTADLGARGYRVVRYVNEDVLRDPEAVVVAIAAECGVEWKA
jgi:very-short-patch-repair endonuclease